MLFITLRVSQEWLRLRETAMTQAGKALGAAVVQRNRTESAVVRPVRGGASP